MSRETVIIGGGISGLVLGYYLAKDGVKPVVIEKERNLGGLSAVYQLERFFIEHYYHYFLSRDANIVELLDELGLTSEIIWQKTKVGLLSFKGVEFLGYLSENGIQNRSSGWDFLSDRDLTFRDKRLLIGLYSRIFSLKDITEIENVPARDWIIDICNQKIYEKIFEPILIAKWGEQRHKISASWLVARLSARLDFRKFIKSNEYVGYPVRSFQSIFSKLENAIADAGGEVIKNAEVVEIRHKDSELQEVVYETDGERKRLPAYCVVSTVPLSLLTKIVSLPGEASHKYRKIEYQRVVCACLVLKEPLSKVLNVVSLPGVSLFNGIVEHTNIVPRKLYDNQTVVYLFKYLDGEKEEWHWTEEDIIAKWTDELERLIPSFNQNRLLWGRVSKTAYGDPVSVLGYSEVMPSLSGPVKGLFVTGLCRIPYVQDCSHIIKLLKEDMTEIKNYLDRL